MSRFLLLMAIILTSSVMAADPGLRELALEGEESELGFPFPDSVWALIVETGIDEGVYTLVGLADGSTSLYYSTGGGIIGAGEHEAVAEATKSMVSIGQEHQVEFSEIEKPLPKPATGMTVIYIRRGKQLLQVSAPEVDFGEDHHSASPVFHAAHEVIHQIMSIKDDGT